MSKISVSTGCLPNLEGRPFYELDSAVRMMKRFLKESKIDGFEFVLLPEWDNENPPLTPTSSSPNCEKHTVDNVLKAVQGQGFPILSVHANRDIGNYLCSEKPEQVDREMRLMNECLGFAKR